MAKKNIQSVEPQVADLANSWLRKYELDYKLEQEKINDEIDKALEDYYTKNGGPGRNRPDAKLLLKDSQGKWYPIVIEYKGYKDKLAKLDSHGVVENKNLKNEVLFKNINSYAVNGAVHYANAIIHHTSFSDIIAIGMTGWKDESGKLRYEIGVYFVSKSNYGLGQKIGDFSDFSFLATENFDNLILQISNLVLPQAERDRIKEQREREISVSLMKLNNDIYINEKNLGENERVYLVAASIIATLGIPKYVPSLKKEDLISSMEPGNTDGEIILRKIKAFLEYKDIPRNKKELIIRNLQNTLTNENINKVDNGQTQLKRVFCKIVDDLGIYYKIGLTTDFTGKLFNEMYNWMGFSQDKLNDVVLTPSYVATLLVKLARVNQDSYVWDFATGSAGLLVAAMNEMLADARNKSTSSENLAIKEQHIKAEQLLGLEVLPGIYMLATLNMILMGDGSSNILNTDSLKDFDGKYGFGNTSKLFPADAFVLNPPYSADGNGMVFVEKALDMMNHGYAAIIIQASAGNGKAKEYNTRILKRHTLLASIKMPGDLFIGKSSVQTYIYVFRVNEKHEADEIVKFIDFSNDGYIRSNRKKASNNLKDSGNAKERYEEVVKLVRFGRSQLKYLSPDEYYEGHIDPYNGCDWNQSAPVSNVPTSEDFHQTISNYMAWKVGEILKHQTIRNSCAVFACKREVEPKGGYKEFTIGDLFEIKPTKAYKLTNNDLYAKKGNTPVVSNSSVNNGIGGYVSLKPTESGNLVTYSDTTTSNAIFYQPNDFIGYSHVQGLYPKQTGWTEKSLLYFIAAFKKAAGGKFDYANKFNRAVASKLQVILPVDNNGNPDLEFMCSYIREHEAGRIREIEAEHLRELEAYLSMFGIHGYTLKPVIDVVLSKDGLKKQYESRNLIAAEPFEVYERPELGETHLIGCYKDKNYLDWILLKNIYTIRLGKRIGSMDRYRDCFENVKFLYLYDLKDSSDVTVFKIIGNKEMSGLDLKEIDYPKKNPGEKYMTFKIQKIEDQMIEFDKVDNILKSLPHHKKGAPVFLKPDERNSVNNSDND